MPVYVIDTIKPKNGLDFPVVEAIDVAVEGYLNLADAVTHFATQSALAELTAAINGKADTADLTAATTSLQNQINNLITPVTQDAEVQNARIGADGTSYQTLKARLDAENTAINNEIAEFGKEHINLFNKSTITPERYINPSNGSLVFSADYYTSAFIDISGYIGEELKMIYSFNAAFYDSNKAWVSSATGTREGNVKSITIPQDVKYIRVCGKNTNINVMQVGIDVIESAYIDFSKINIINAILNKNQVIGLAALDTEVQNARTSESSTTYATLKERLDKENAVLTADIADLGKERINLFNTTTITPERYINNENGSLIFSASYYTSDYIDIGDFVSEDITILYSFNAAFYDSSKGFVSPAVGTKTGNVRIVTVPQGVKYLRTSGNNNDLSKMQVGINVSESQYCAYKYVKLTNAILDQSQVMGLNELDIERINLFNKNAITENRYISPEDGSLIYSADYYVSDYIDISSLVGDSINMTYSFNAAFYDSSKEWVSSASGSGSGNIKTVEIPTGVTYIRVCGNNTNLNVMQVGKGVTTAQYFSYDDLKISNISIAKDKVIGLQVPETHHVYVGASRAIKTISAALESITDASENNKYIIHVDKGNYEETFHTKDYVDIIGENPYNTIINYTSDDESDWVNRSTVFATSYTTLENLTITTTGSKYPLHCDGAYNVPYRVIVKNCILMHNGFTTLENQAGTGVGIGLYHSQHVELIECEIYGKNGVYGSADVYCHNSADNDEAHSKYRSLRVERCVLGECTYGIRLQALENNQLQDNDCFLISNINNGTTPEYFQHNAKESWHVRKF